MDTSRQISLGGPFFSAARRIEEIQTPIIPIVGDWIRRSPGTISLGQGVVAYGPPPQARRRLEEFWDNPQNHKYQAVDGIPALRDQIRAKLARENGMTEPQAIVVTAGGNMAFLNAVLAVTDPDDEVILQRPFYFNHEMAVRMAGARTVTVETDAAYQLKPEAIAAAISNRTRAVVTISPNNPTGAVYPEEALRVVNRICRARGLYHIHDEAYEYFTYDGVRHFSPGSIPGGADHTISLFSLSKAYGFASWRIGYMVLPERLLVAVKKIQDTNLICPPVASQFAAWGALEAGRAYCAGRLQAIEAVRQIVLDELAKLDRLARIPPATGAFYLLLRLNTRRDPVELTEQLIREHQIAVIPGTAFGMTDGCYLRVAYGTLDASTAREGIGRLVRGLKAICGAGET